MISVIIPTLNEQEHIGSLLSFLNQCDQKDRFEVIVVDGGSEDNTAAIVKEHNVTFLSSESCSRACQMNLGASQASGDIFYFIHADTLPVKSLVSDLQYAVEKGHQSGCYRFKFQDPPNPLLHINGFFTRFPFKWCRGGDQTFFITREAFQKLEGFDESYVIMEDYEILDRLDAMNTSFKIIPKSVRVSARKYFKNSYLKVQRANFNAMKMYRSGSSPEQIKKVYNDALMN